MSIAAVTLTGFVAMEPRLLFTKQNHTPVVNLRVGTTPRRVDVTTGEWRDLPSSFFTVNCWRRLAYSVSSSLNKGDPVIIRGRLKSRSWNDNGVMRYAVDIEAESVGHDMAYGWAHFMKGMHPGMKEMLEKMGMAETPYGIDGTGELGVPGRPGAQDGYRYPGQGTFGAESHEAMQDTESAREAESGWGAGAAREPNPGWETEPARVPEPGWENQSARDGEAAGAAEGETEDSASLPDGALAAEGAPF